MVPPLATTREWDGLLELKMTYFSRHSLLNLAKYSATVGSFFKTPSDKYCIFSNMFYAGPDEGGEKISAGGISLGT